MTVPSAETPRHEPPGPRGLGALLARYRHLSTIAAQGCVSAFHFSLNLLLLQLVTPYEYGVFAFAFVLAMFATGINHALVSTPLLVYTPVLREPAARRAQEAMLASANLLLCALLLLGGTLWALGTAHADSTGAGVTLFVAVYSARQYSRSIGYARLRPLVTAAGDIAYVLSGILLVGLLHALDGALPIGGVLGALALANLVAMLVERIGIERAAGLRERVPRRFSLRGYGRIWEQSRWSLAGAMTSLCMAQVHALIVTSTHGPDAFAPLAAGFVLFGPIRIALQTWQNTVKPEIAIGLAEGRFEDVRVQLRRTVRLVSLAVLAMGLALLASWPWVHELLYARRYAQEPMAGIVAVWFLITLVGASYNPPSAALQAMRGFRALAIPTICGALVGTTLAWVALGLYAPDATLWAVLAAETLVALWVPRLLHARLGRSSRAHPADPAGAALPRGSLHT